MVKSRWTCASSGFRIVAMNERPEISDELSALRARVIDARHQVEILVDGIDDEQFSCRPGTN